MFKRLIYLTLFVLVLVVVQPVTHAQQVENLLLNPSFEEDEVILDDPAWEQWTTWGYEGGLNSTVEIDETEFIDGTRSLRVNPTGSTNWYFIVLQDYIPLKVGTEYTASFWAKGQEPRPITAKFKATDNSVDWAETNFELTTDWAEYHFTAEALNAEVKLEIFCSGVEIPLWLDFLFVYEGEYVAGIGPGASSRVKATAPEPVDGAVHEDTWVGLGWQSGDFAVSHDVYLGDNFEDVNGGAEAAFRGNLGEASLLAGFIGYPYPDGLVPGTTYYWRVDEVNEAEPNSPWKGDVWSFSIPPKTAYNPSPADGAEFIAPDAELSWTAGLNAKLHNVYFGDNFDDVNNAAVGSQQTATTYTPGALELEKTYYWRVDELDPPIAHKGDVWSFRTIHEIPITNPNLVGWWGFDEGSGLTVIDQSGYGNHGTLKNDPQWVIGYDGGALMFDGVNDFVEVPHDEILTVDNEVTVMAWINAQRYIGPAGDDWQGIMAKGNPRSYSLYTEVSGALHFSTAGVGTLSTTLVPLNEWVHVAAQVIDGGHQYYINGEDAGTGGSGIVLPGASDTATVLIGTARDDNREFLGMIDDVRIYNRALTQDEINQIMRGDPTIAWNPDPANGATKNIDQVMPLSWSPGETASQHDVYFGTDRDAVKNADVSDTTGIYRGRQGSTNYNASQDVEWGGGPYYWRIDEVNSDGTVSKGKIWSFMVADYLTVDDFESYNDINEGEPGSNRIYLAWLDGYDDPANGSTVGHLDPPFAEQTIVHSGRQSMPFSYENSVGKSWATSVLTYPRDWTENGVDRLVIWYIGDAANAAETMYVVLNGTAGVDNDNPNAAQVDEWTEWSIDLQVFGINLTNVNTITLGFGNRTNPVAGGSGTVFFDDIRLYAPAP